MCLFLFSGFILARYVEREFWRKTRIDPLPNFDWGVFVIPPVSHGPPSGASKMPQKVYLLCRHFRHKGGKYGFGGRLRGGCGSFFEKFLRGKCFEFADIWVNKRYIWGVYVVEFCHLSQYIDLRYSEKTPLFAIYRSIGTKMLRQVSKQSAYMPHYRPKYVHFADKHTPTFDRNY